MYNMVKNDSLSDFISRLNVAILTENNRAIVPLSKWGLDIIYILYREGIIRRFKFLKNNRVEVTFGNYSESGENKFFFKKISSKGNRRYHTYKELLKYEKENKGLNFYSTIYGVILGKTILDMNLNVGGEFLIVIK